MIRSPKLALLAAIALAMALSACGSDKSSIVSSSDEPSITSSTSTSLPSTTAAAAASTATSVPATNDTSHLVAVRVTPSGAGDLVTFEFDNGVPGYSLTTTQSPVTQDGSGNPVAVDGVSVSQIVFANASTVDLTNGVTTFYNGSKRFTPPNANVVAEAVQIGDFEARLSWAIGLKTQAPVTVSTVASPPQVVLTVG